MRHDKTRFLAAFVMVLLMPPIGLADSDDGKSLDLGIGGVGGVYFLAPPGELTVELEKRDRNRRGQTTELRAILFGPDRQVLQEMTIPDDGQGRGSSL